MSFNNQLAMSFNNAVKEPTELSSLKKEVEKERKIFERKMKEKQRERLRNTAALVCSSHTQYYKYIPQKNSEVSEKLHLEQKHSV